MKLLRMDQMGDHGEEGKKGGVRMKLLKTN